MRDLYSLPARKLLESLRQVVGLRHHCAVDQHGNDRHVALERGFDFDAHEIVGIIKAAAIVLVRAREPIPADNRDQRIASANALCQHFDEIAAGRDVVDVDEDVLAPKAVLQAIIDAPREPGRVFSAIANEDAAPHAMPSWLEED